MNVRTFECTFHPPVGCTQIMDGLADDLPGAGEFEQLDKSQQGGIKPVKLLAAQIFILVTLREKLLAILDPPLPLFDGREIMTSRGEQLVLKLVEEAQRTLNAVSPSLLRMLQPPKDRLGDHAAG